MICFGFRHLMLNGLDMATLFRQSPQHSDGTLHESQALNSTRKQLSQEWDNEDIQAKPIRSPAVV